MFSIFLCSVFFLTSSHFAKLFSILFYFYWRTISSVTVTWDATCRQTVGHTEIFLALSAFFEWPNSTGATVHKPCRKLIYIYQHFEFAQGYLTDNISSLICKSAWDTQVDLHWDSWKSRLLRRPILGEMCLTALIICLQVTWHSSPISLAAARRTLPRIRAF